MTLINGKIYAIVSPSIFKCYIGSTKHYIKQRLWKHVNANGCASSIIIKQPDYKIIILETLQCKTIEELRKREGVWIEAMKGSGMLVNKNTAGRTREERIKAQNIKNKEYHKKWCCDNITHIKKREHEYYLENKESINIRKNQKFICECGGKYTNANRNAHKETIKHIKHMNSDLKK